MHSQTALQAREVSPPRPRRRPAWPQAALLGLSLLGLPALTGCSSGATDTIGEVGAIGVGGAVGAATGSAVLGIVAGLGTTVAIDEGHNFAERRFYRSKQDSIAEAAGSTAVGDVATWTHRAPLDVSASRGRLEVVRSFGQIASCKEFVYTSEPLPAERLENAGTYKGGGPVAPVDLDAELPAETEILVATACRNGDGAWQWAQSRPSTATWGGLQ